MHSLSQNWSKIPSQLCYCDFIIKSLTLSFISTPAKYVSRLLHGIDLLNMVSHARIAPFLKPVWLTTARVTSMRSHANAVLIFFLQTVDSRYVLRAALRTDDASLLLSLRIFLNPLWKQHSIVYIPLYRFLQVPIRFQAWMRFNRIL